MLELRATVTTSATPADVLAAAEDFSERRAEIWPNVKLGHYEVHARGHGYVEATEWLWPVGSWERCRYERPHPEAVRATVLDSNVLQPGSTWELTAVPIGCVTRVEAVFLREFQRGIRGSIAKTINRLAGNRLAGHDLRRAVRAIENSPARSRSSAPPLSNVIRAEEVHHGRHTHR